MRRIQDHGFPLLRARHPMAHPTTVTPPTIALDHDAWPDFWADAVRALRALGYRTSTLLFYRQILRAFSRFVDKPPRAVLPVDLLRYLRSLSAQPCSWHWSAMNLSVLRALFDKLAGLNALTDRSGPRRKCTLPEHLSYAEMTAMLGTAQTLRDQLLLALLYGCGLKTAELQHLTWNHFDSEQGCLVLPSRNAGTRRLPVPAAFVPLLCEGKSRCPGIQYIFPGARDTKPLSARAIQRIVRACAIAAGIEKPVSPMTLRHTYAIHALEAGASVRHVQESLDHAMVETTMRYYACIPATATPLGHAAPSPRASSQSCARDREESSPTPDTPVVLAPDPAWESLVMTPFPLRSSGEGFLHQCRVKLRSRFLAVRGFFSSG